ncbi:hypothetical protein [Metallosphaera hakonensis]|uniref:Glycosyl transferase family 2 n=1 Tax=Metallosphaera hakonensis JCM 8857 = DSM 7519 TaxID=1293036 RepID=A0A2U9ITT2_9CREN|nr:hypothetical protein [Metallosphaera hakonensis]AWR99383.1 hypothetical protein DFR87_06340 [Metallosphaera hakonensis JCM 8857 = DSM 7519]
MDIENLFTSDDVKKIEQIYSDFNRESIISWMRNRLTADISIFEINGDEEIVVVIPTADVNGSKARESSEVFRGSKIILVESKGSLFNYARSVNAGVKYALNFSPKWVVVSNDDVHKIDDMSTLRDQLSTATKGLVLAKPSKYHSYAVSLMSVDKLEFIKAMSLIGKTFRLPPAEVYGYLTVKYGEKLGIKTMVLIDSMIGPFKRIGGKIVDSFINGGSFMILNRNIINEKILDETFINGYEDVYFSMKMRNDMEIIDFRINEDRGASLGFGKFRFYRSYVNEIYLNWLLWG